MPSKHLVLIAVGPVQDFIAAGRKVRDIWYGSHCLSELSKRLAAKLHQTGCELVFPSPGNLAEDLLPNSGLCVVNRILAVAPEGCDVKELCTTLRTEVKTYWTELADGAENEAPNLVEKDLFDKQLDDLGEFYMVWTPLGESYSKARQRAEHLMSARKCARTFQAPGWDGDELRKSSLDGVRETVLRDKAAECSHGRIRTGEELDALGFIKRMGSFAEAGNFDSLVNVAVLTYQKGLEKTPDIKTAYEKLSKEGKELSEQKLGRQIGWPEMFYVSRLEALLREHRLEKKPPIPEVEAFSKKLSDFQKAHGEPENYLCFLLGDGDFMGRALDAMADMTMHQNFSRELSRFAKEAGAVVKRHEGTLIYSGGDDVMAYLPMHTALQCALELNREFEKIMKTACAGTRVKPPTFSAGLVITHHSESLSEVFAQARMAEQDAKNRGGRDALAVWQNKRQHRGIRLAGRWAALPVRLEAFTALYMDKALPARFGYQLRALSKQCGDTLLWKDNAGVTTPANVAAAEALRVLGRKATDAATKEKLMNLLRECGTLRQLSDELVVALQFARSRSMAAGTPLEEDAD